MKNQLLPNWCFRLSKNRVFVVVLVCVFATISSGCASTKITSFTDPDYTKSVFHRVLVIANSERLDARLGLEDMMVKEFSKKKIFAIQSYKLLPPTRYISDSLKIEILLKNNIDSYISIFFGGKGIEQEYIPPLRNSTSSHGTISVSGNTATINTTSTTTNNQGVTISKPWAEFDTRFFDVANGRIIWMANTFTGGNALSNFSTVNFSFCSQIVSDLFTNGLVAEEKTIPESKISMAETSLHSKSGMYISLNGKPVRIMIAKAQELRLKLKNDHLIEGSLLSYESEEQILSMIVIRNEIGEIFKIKCEDISELVIIKSIKE